MKPGIYKGKGKGFDWIKPVEVEVEVDEKSIKNINIVDFKNTRETKPYLKSVEDCMIPRIIESQSLKVDAICGATMSSSGVKGAVRDALKQASAAGGDPEEYKKFNKDLKKKTDVIELKYDVVVAGLAGAGMAAAISAAEQMKKAERPVSVLGLETSGKIGTMPAEIFGINPKRYCDKYNGGKPYFDDPEELYDYWVNEYNHGVCKPELLRLLFDESGETLDWLEFDHGCYMHSAMKGFGECKWLCKYRFQLGSGWEDGHVYEGLQRNWDRYEAMDFYYRRLTDDFVKLGGEYMLETTVYELLYDKDRRKVTGVKARRYDGTEYIIHADVVVSCTGGFHGNPDMMEKYLSDEYYPFKSREWHLYGMGQNKGQLIQSAIDNGAATYNIGMSPLIHLKAPAGFINKYPYQIRENPKTHAKELWSVNDVACSIGCQEMGIRISKNGRRTHNEGGTFAFWTAGPTWYSICGTDYLNQIAEKGFEGPEGGLSRSARINCYGGVPNNMPVPEAFDVMEEGIKKGFVYKADTLEELAEKIGVPAAAFTEEIAKYRQFCADGIDRDFGKKPELLKDIVKEGPYYAVRCNTTPYATMAALDVDTNINVLDTDGQVMNGLYACGNDSEGVLYAPDVAYATFGGIALAWAFTTGRLAGINCVKYLEKTN